jgi:8-oxo-dGTP diphosphatase
MSEIMVQRIAMKGIIVKEGKVLILREAATYEDGTQVGRYHVPGGRIEVGENFEDALRREIREETGLEVDIIMPIYVGEWRPVIKGVQNQIVATFFVCEPTSNKEVVLSTEHDDFKWIDPTKSNDFDLMGPEDEVIDRYLQLAKKGVFD